MVSDTIISRFTGPLPASAAADRTILGGPLYPSAEVLELLKAGESAIRVWTRKCTADMQKLALDPDDLVELIGQAVSAGRFIGAEWCRQNPFGPWAACDAYSLIRQERMAAACRDMPMEYYLKFAIGKTGKILLLVSCHLS